jgi:hypothetical protein
LGAFPNGIKIVADEYFAVLENSDEPILVIKFSALNILHRMELPWLGFNQGQPAMLGILAGISYGILEDRLPLSVDLCSGTLSTIRDHRDDPSKGPVAGWDSGR